MDTEEVLFEAEANMEKTLEHMLQEFSAIRTGKASPALVNNLNVEAYGSVMKLQEVAVVSAPEPRMLVIQPFDASTTKDVEKAIKDSRLGVNPVNDGRVLRLPFPELSKERREELSKQVKTVAEEARVAIRGHRRTALDAFKKGQKNSEITEDEYHTLENKVQKLTDDFIKKIDEALESKTKDIMTV
jgi:ribosome recycling factor